MQCYSEDYIINYRDYMKEQVREDCNKHWNGKYGPDRPACSCELFPKCRGSLIKDNILLQAFLYLVLRDLEVVK